MLHMHFSIGNPFAYGSHLKRVAYESFPLVISFGEII